MKKIFSIFLMSLLCFAAGATDVTIDFTAQGYANQADVTSLSQGGVSLTFAKGSNTANQPKYYTNGTAVRMYNGNTLTISASQNITEIEFTCVSGYGPTGTFNTGEISNNTWTGEATSVVYTCGSAQTRIQKMVVTLDDGGANVLAPTIVCDYEEPYYEGDVIEVTLEDNNDGATLYYSYDNDEWEEYEEELYIYETCTLYAKAELDGTESPVVSRTFTFNEPAASVATVSALTALANQAEFTFTGNLTVVYQKGSYLYVKDNTGCTLIYKNGVGTFQPGDVLAGGWGGTVSIYNGLFEAVPSDATLALADNGTPEDVTATELTIPQISADNVNQYIVIKNVKLSSVSNRNFTITDENNNTITGRQGFENGFPTHPDINKHYDVEGFVAIYSNNSGTTLQVYPTAYNEVIDNTQHAVPVITVSPDQANYIVGDQVTVTVTTEDGASIGFRDSDWDVQADPYEAYYPQASPYTKVISVNEPQTVKISAFAYDANGEMLKSEVVYKELVFVAAPSNDAFTLVTSVDQIGEGNEYVLVYSNSDTGVEKAMAEQDTGYRDVVDPEDNFTIAGNKLTLAENSLVCVFTLEAAETDGQYLINVGDDNYLYYTGTKNNVYTGENGDPMSFTLSSGKVVIANEKTSGRYLQYNPGNPRFAFYTGTQQNGYLYYRDAAAAPAKPIDVIFTPEEGTYTAAQDVKVQIKNTVGEYVATYYIDNDEVQYDETDGIHVDHSCTLTVEVLDSRENAETVTFTADYVINYPAMQITFNPAAGTYYEPQTVHISVANTVGDYTVTYKIGEGDETYYDDETGIYVDENMTITAMVMDSRIGNDYYAEATAAYVISNETPQTATATIVFNDNGADESSNLSSNDLLDYITVGCAYVESASDISKVYKGKTGLKFSSGSVNGAVTLNFANAFTGVTKVEVSAEAWLNSSGNADAGAAINGVEVSSELATYTIATNLESLASLTLTATKRIYLKSITITYQTANPMITLGEALLGNDNDEVTLSDELAIAGIAPVGGNLFATDGNGNWTRIDYSELDETEINGILNGATGLKGIKGVISGLATAPVITLSDMPEAVDADAPQIRSINLAHSFEMPKGSEIVKFTGYYNDGLLRGWNGYGQSLELSNQYLGADFAMEEGKRYDVEVAVRYKANADGAPRRISSTEGGNNFQNIVGDAIARPTEAVVTGIENLNGSKAVKSVRYYNVAGVESAEPVNGMNIIVTEYSDGTRTATKVVK